jgi:transcriptional regulator with XRE-family HTH domain
MANLLELLDENTLRKYFKMKISTCKVSIKDVSRLSGVSVSAISRWLNGKTTITYDSLYRISRVIAMISR